MVPQTSLTEAFEVCITIKMILKEELWYGSSTGMTLLFLKSEEDDYCVR